MQRTDETRANGKKKYRKPSVRMIPLRPEEAVLGSCKASTTGTLNAGGGHCTIPVNCSTIGS
jgi:hypothetical protein